MAFDDKNLSDYIDVAQRIADFRETYPDGVLQAHEPWRIVQVQCSWCRRCIGRRTVKSGGGYKKCDRCEGSGLRSPGEDTLDSFIVYVAAAYRTPDDPRPGIGTAWEAYPGQTPYTAGSELMNAETSAWGRAIIAVGASDAKKGIASREEVRNRNAERDDGLPVNRDGSLSRSRTTDDEKDAAGVMTSEQHAAHTALAKGADGKLPPAEAAKVQNVTATPPDDPFYDAPPTDDTPAEDRHGTANAHQLRAIGIRMTNAGIKDRDARLAETRRIIGRDLKSSTDLSYNEAQQVIAALDKKETA